MTHAAWPEGTVISQNTWHFHRRLFERYNGRILRPGEFSRILGEIRHGHIKPLKLKYNESESLRIFCYISNYSGEKRDRIYVVASADGRHLVSAYKPEWVHKKSGVQKKKKKRWHLKKHT